MMAPICEKSQQESSTQGADRRQDERREHVRFPFTAAVEAVEPRSDIKLRGRTSDISSGGCYVDTISPFILGTTIKIRLTKGGVIFEAEAIVVLSQVGMGMGIAFRSTAPNQIRNLRQWLNELEGKSSPNPAPSETVHNNSAPRTAIEETVNVLSELILTLTRKGVLSGDEGKGMLRRL
jgi:PilZ domain